MLHLSLLRRTTCLSARRSLITFVLPQRLTANSSQLRLFSSSSSSFDDSKTQPPPTSDSGKPPYVGPLAQTFRRLKIFSISSLSLSCTLAPFMFIVESNLPVTARIALASIAIGTSGISTGLVGWCGQSYVTTLSYLKPEENGGAEGVQLTTQNLLLKPRVTTVYDPTFLIETRRAFAKWELADKMVLSGDKTPVPGTEETIAETTDKDGNILGHWVVKWGEGGEGTCHEVGKIIRYFNVHEELL